MPRRLLNRTAVKQQLHVPPLLAEVRHSRPAEIDCGLNWWMQHTRGYRSRRSVADEAEATDLLLSKPEGTHMGTLAEGGHSSPDRTII